MTMRRENLKELLYVPVYIWFSVLLLASMIGLQESGARIVVMRVKDLPDNHISHSSLLVTN